MQTYRLNAQTSPKRFKYSTIYSFVDHNTSFNLRLFAKKKHFVAQQAHIYTLISLFWSENNLNRRSLVGGSV